VLADKKRVQLGIYRGARPARAGDNGFMTAELFDSDACHLCKARREPAFCRIYEADRRITLCSPACASAFFAGPAANGNGAPAGDFLARYMTEWRWRELGK